MKLTQKMIQSLETCEKSKFELSASLHDDDILVLVAILKRKLHIKYLDLSCNKITEKGALALASLTHLIYLNLSSNSITNKAAMELLKIKTLVSLDFSCNPPLDDNLGNIILSSSIHHVSLKLRHTNISIPIIERVESICSKNQKLQQSLTKQVRVSSANERLDDSFNGSILSRREESKEQSIVESISDAVRTTSPLTVSQESSKDSVSIFSFLRPSRLIAAQADYKNSAENAVEISQCKV